MPYADPERHRSHMREYMREKRGSKTRRPRKPKPQHTAPKSLAIKRDRLLERLNAGYR